MSRRLLARCEVKLMCTSKNTVPISTPLKSLFRIFLRQILEHRCQLVNLLNTYYNIWTEDKSFQIHLHSISWLQVLRLLVGVKCWGTVGLIPILPARKIQKLSHVSIMYLPAPNDDVPLILRSLVEPRSQSLLKWSALLRCEWLK